MNCSLCDRVKNTFEGSYPYLVHEFNNSFLFLGEHQFYPGYCVLVTKLHFREMTDLPTEVRLEFFKEMMITQEIIQKVFQPKKMNLCSLGNAVEHLHWHFFPRYADDPHATNPPWLQMHLFESAKINALQGAEVIQRMKDFISSSLSQPQ